MTRRSGLRAACLAAALSLSIGLAGAPARAETPIPLPSPIYANTPSQTKPPSEMGADACTVAPVSRPGAEKVPWQLTRLGMPDAWRVATGKGIRIAVIDTGISYTSSLHTPAARFSAFDVLPLPSGASPDSKFDCEHGTAVASLIAAQPAGSDTEFSGIAPEAEVIGIRALYGTAPQSIDGVVAAIHEAISLNVRIINISQAGGINRGEYADAIQAALDAGIVVVAAAGNVSAMNGAPIAYPAAYPGVIGVGMTDRADVAHPESLPMPGYVSVAAPGVGLTALAPANAATGEVYTILDHGTSYSTPLVTGVVALMLEQGDRRGVRLTPAEVKARLEATADPPAGPIPDPRLGHGIVNPVRALSDVTPAPTGEPVSQPSQSQTPRPAPPPDDPFPLQLALVVAALAVGGVALGVALRAALPAARSRGGRAAEPPVPNVDS